MSELDDRAIQDIPQLRASAIELRDLAFEMLNCQVPIVGPFNYLARIFLTKQANHMNMVIQLNQNRDATLIVRSMLEGVAQVIWVDKRPKLREQRATRWIDFAAVGEWRSMKARVKRGLEFAEEEKKRIIENALAVGKKFIKRKFRKRFENGEDILGKDDPFYSYWTTKGPSQLISEADRSGTKRVFYRFFSDWQHWNPAAFGQAISMVGTTVHFRVASPSTAAMCLSNAFDCLLATARIANRALVLDFSGRLDEADKRLDDYLEAREGGMK